MCCAVRPYTTGRGSVSLRLGKYHNAGDTQLNTTNAGLTTSAELKAAGGADQHRLNGTLVGVKRCGEHAKLHGKYEFNASVTAGSDTSPLLRSTEALFRDKPADSSDKAPHKVLRLS